MSCLQMINLFILLHNCNLVNFSQIVGQSVKPHGILFSGGPSITGPVADDLHMEITMLQIYKVALSAGKAHRDHKHHHVHHFDHDGLATTTPAPPPPIVVISLLKHYSSKQQLIFHLT